MQHGDTYVLFLFAFYARCHSGGEVEVESYYLGELNFCLGSQDSVLTGPSITKALNTASNQMVKNLLILNSPGQSSVFQTCSCRDSRRTVSDGILVILPRAVSVVSVAAWR